MGKLKFHNITSAVDLSFWHVLAKKKLEELKLQDGLIPLSGYYSTSNNLDLPPVFRIISESFSQTPSIPSNAVRLPGLLKIFNTKEEFDKASREDLLKATSDLIGRESIVAFLMIVYADLKNFVFNYWVAFPVFNFKPVEFNEGAVEIDMEKLKEKLAEKVSEGSLRPVFGIKPEGEITEDWDEGLIGYLDPAAQSDFPSAILRNLIGILSRFKSGTTQRFLAIKNSLSSNPQFFNISSTKLYTVEIPETSNEFIGWEANNKGKQLPKLIDLRPQLDPHSLAHSAVDLNLKLMRWRMMPEINLEAIADCRCLLLGAGTLGSQLSRNLLAWGIRHITFVDSGKVSYSNPVRQSLYEFEDAKDGVAKAVRAASKLKQVYPGVVSEGVQMEVLMPGHSIASNEAQAQMNYQTLENLIKDHDAVFLLTDSRESRWLPALISAAFDKICFSVALGFDSFLVVRHGGKPGNEKLGCYFCNDVVGPRNSLTDRTLDQQCTVTRPGLSYQASAVAVELLVSLLQHPLRQKAGHLESTCLGSLPHQLRGSFSSFSINTYVSTSFSKCTACSSAVVDLYLNQGFEFVKKACNDPEYLEEVCGLKELTNVNEDDLIEIDELD